MNPFLADLDPERTTARRLEIRRSLAHISIMQQRMRELNGLMKDADLDSDAAAEEHGIAASALQDELNKLDERAVDAILDGSTSPESSLTRRSEILQELARLNLELESRCEANRQKKQSYVSQHNDLRPKVAKRAELENELKSLAGSEYRVQSAILKLEIQANQLVLNEAMRQRDVALHNHKLETDWDSTNKQRTASESTLIQAAKLDDAKKVCDHFQKRLSESLRASEEFQRANSN